MLAVIYLFVIFSGPTDCTFMPVFLQELRLHQLISTLLLLPPGLLRFLLHGTTIPRSLGPLKVSHHGPAFGNELFGNELSAVTLFFVQYYQVTWELQMYLIIGTVEMIATKPETMTFPWGVISQTEGGDKRADLWPFIKITQNWLFIEVDFCWKAQA